MKSVLILISAILFLGACGNSSDSNEGGGEAGSQITYATYEISEGCSTGVQKVNAANEADLKKAFGRTHLAQVINQTAHNPTAIG